MFDLITFTARTRAASRALATLSYAARSNVILAIAKGMQAHIDSILAANQDDLDAATNILPAQRDRLILNKDRIDSACAGLRAVAALPDPLGQTRAKWTRPNGLSIERISVAIGVIAIIYEARPLVTVDAAALCLLSGNACLLRPGSDSFRTAQALGEVMTAAFESVDVDPASAMVVPTTNRDAVGTLLAGANGNIDVVVPRGGRSLVERVQQEARIPVIGHLDGVCHVYIDQDADHDMAIGIALNAKMRRTGICGAAETILVDRACANNIIPELVDRLIEAGCEVRGDTGTQALHQNVIAATKEDWSTEYLAAIVSIRIVDGVVAATTHIAAFGSGHTDSIVTNNADNAATFVSLVDSAIVMHNASTQFADGGEFGMGAEIGIATGRLPPRGPVGAEELTSYKYVVRGTGQMRSP